MCVLKLPLWIVAAALVVVAGLPSRGSAAPAADVVVIWAPGAQLAPIAEVARRAGAVVIDRSPAADPAPGTAALVKRAIAAYDALRYDDAWAALDEARALVDRTGAAGLAQTELADLFLYRGLIKVQQGELNTSWDELVASVTIDPVRVLDPARFPPRVASELARVHQALADRARAALVVDAPAGCTVQIDGAAAGAA